MGIIAAEWFSGAIRYIFDTYTTTSHTVKLQRPHQLGKESDFPREKILLLERIDYVILQNKENFLAGQGQDPSEEENKCKFLLGDALDIHQ